MRPAFNLIFDNSENDDMSDAELSALIGSLIREQRKKAGLRQIDVAQRCNTSKATISKIEHGTRGLHFKELFIIAPALNMDPDDLFKLVYNRLVSYGRELRQRGNSNPPRTS